MFLRLETLILEANRRNDMTIYSDNYFNVIKQTRKEASKQAGRQAPNKYVM